MYCPYGNHLLTNDSDVRGRTHLFSFLQALEKASHEIILTPDQEKKILDELPNTHFGFIQTSGDGLQQASAYTYVRDKLQKNMNPQRFTYFDWTTRPHSYFSHQMTVMLLSKNCFSG